MAGDYVLLENKVIVAINLDVVSLQSHYYFIFVLFKTFENLNDLLPNWDKWTTEQDFPAPHDCHYSHAQFPPTALSFLSISHCKENRSLFFGVKI